MNVVLTCLFTGCSDPQRPKGSNPDWEMAPRVDKLVPLLNSITGSDVFIFHDELPDDQTDGFRAHPSSNYTFVREPTPIGNVYMERWRVYRRWLSDFASSVRRVFCVDGTDVVMRHFPFHHMRDNVLYTCSEQGKFMDLPWLANNHHSIRTWAKGHKFLPLLNAGICGGDWNTVFGFLSRLIDGALLAAEAQHDMTDMGAFNRTAWDNYGERLVFGPRVHTVFTEYENDNGYSWWSHR